MNTFDDMSIRHSLLFFLVTCCVACGNVQHSNEPVTQPIPYTIVNRSALFNDKNITFKLDSLSSTLYISLSVKDLKKFPFPISRRSKDTLFKTAFDFDFYWNGRIIESDYRILSNKSRDVDSSANAGHLSLSTDTISLNRASEINFVIPLYAFHNLKKGKQTIELSMSQSLFTEEVKVLRGSSEDSDYMHVYETKPLLNARVRFDVNIPPIYKSIVYGYGLQLKNDSTFSPAGMDHTLWKSSYPDLYWTINYPVNVFYTQTPVEKSTDRYTAYDTFNLYHYYANDSIDICVYDHDNLSKDDGLGYWTGPLERLSRSRINRISFGNVKAFDVKVEKKGLIN